jgi:hypothetical protein
MTFDEWIQRWRDAQPSGKLSYGTEEGAEEAWDYQQGRIEALQQQVSAEQHTVLELAEQQVESLDGALGVAVRWANKRGDRHLQSSRSTGEGQ